MFKLEERMPLVKGALGLWYVNARGDWTLQARQPNQIQYSWAHILTQLLRRQRQFAPNAIYLEFENVADPATAVTVPTFGRDEGLEYFANLQYSATRDFLRLPLLQDPLISIAAGYEAYFTEGVSGNVATYFAMSSGVVGVHGKTFSDTTHSKVCGACLVATPAQADWTQDVIFSRTYLATAQQVVKSVSHQVGITWDIVVE